MSDGGNWANELANLSLTAEHLVDAQHLQLQRQTASREEPLNARKRPTSGVHRPGVAGDQGANSNQYAELHRQDVPEKEGARLEQHSTNQVNVARYLTDDRHQHCPVPQAPVGAGDDHRAGDVLGDVVAQPGRLPGAVAAEFRGEIAQQAVQLAKVTVHVGGGDEGAGEEEDAEANEGDDQVGKDENVCHLQDIHQQTVSDEEGDKIVRDENEKNAVWGENVEFIF